MADNVQQPAESPEQFGSSAERWIAELNAWERASERWMSDSRRIAQRYALEKAGTDGASSSTGRKFRGAEDGSFALLWSNTNTLAPELYDRPPSPVVERRHRDPDPVGRLAATVMQRALDADMERDASNSIFEAVVQDHLLVGRGVPWIRYDPTFSDTEVPLADGAEPGAEREIRTEIVDERAPIEHIQWDDFAHKPVRDWAELQRDGWVARRVMMTREQGRKRFGDVFDQVPLTAGAHMSSTISAQLKEVVGRGEVFEVWDAATQRVFWVCKGVSTQTLDEKDDPLKLTGFFPCPQPAYATRSNSTLIPTPDFLQYSDLADQVDELTDRIAEVQSAIRVRGIYDISMPNLANLLSTGPSGLKMYPVPGITEYLAKGSGGSIITGVVQFLPIELFAAVLINLYEARENAKSQIHEISGISDIQRGQLQNPNEKLGQTKLKGNSAMRRLSAKRRRVDDCLRDTIRLKAEIMLEHFGDDTLRSMSGFDQLPDITRLMATEPQGDAKDPEASERQRQDNEQVVERIWGRVLELLRNERELGFRIDVETDSTVGEGDEVERRMAFLDTVGNFLERSLPVMQAFPDLSPLMGDLVLFSVRSFRSGRSLEAAFEDATRKLVEMSQAPPPEEQGPSEDEVKVQAEMQKAEIAGAAGEQAIQIAGIKASTDIQAKQAQAQIENEAAMRKAEINAITSTNELEVKMAELDLKRQELEVKGRALALKAAADASNPNGGT